MKLLNTILIAIVIVAAIAIGFHFATAPKSSGPQLYRYPGIVTNSYGGRGTIYSSCHEKYANGTCAYYGYLNEEFFTWGVMFNGTSMNQQANYTSITDVQSMGSLTFAIPQYFINETVWVYYGQGYIHALDWRAPPGYGVAH